MFRSLRRKSSSVKTWEASSVRDNPAKELGRRGPWKGFEQGKLVAERPRPGHPESVECCLPCRADPRSSSMHWPLVTKIPASILLLARIECSGSGATPPTPNIGQTIDVAVRATVEAIPTATIVPAPTSAPTPTLVPTATIEPPPGYELFDEARPGVYGLLHSNVESIIWRTDTYTSFYLDRFETATQAIVELLSVSFQDGTVCKDGQLFPAQ